MKGRKLKVPNIIKKHTKVPHQNEIGTQPAFITSKPVKIKKKTFTQDITSNTYKAEEKMRGFRNMLKGIK